MMMIAFALTHFGDTTRQLYLYDTFKGMTEPDDIDHDFDGMPLRPIWADSHQKGMMMGFGGSAEDVKENLRRTSYPESLMHFIEDDVLQTIPARVPTQIALLRLDTDWYKSTLHELKHLYPLLVSNGV